MPTFNIPKQARNKYNFIKGSDNSNFITQSQLMMSSGGFGGGGNNGTTYSQVQQQINDTLAERGLPLGYDIVSSYDLKTINGYSLIGYGDIEIIGGDVDLSAYATKTYVADYVNTYAPEPDLSSYVTKVELDAAGYACVYECTYNQYNSIQVKDPDTIYIITDEDPMSLMGYATKSYVADYVTTYATTPDLSSYVTKTELNNAGYVTSANLDTTLNSYATKSELNDYVTKTDITQASYLETTGGDITGQLYIGYNAPNNASYSLNTYSHIVAGTKDKTTVSLIGTKRMCGNESYMSAFFTNSDGRSKFTHKAQGTNADPGSGSDDAFLCFNAYGFKLAYSGVSGTGATTEYDIVHTGNINSFGFITYVSFDTSTYTLTISI